MLLKCFAEEGVVQDEVLAFLNPKSAGGSFRFVSTRQSISDCKYQHLDIISDITKKTPYLYLRIVPHDGLYYYRVYDV